MILIMLCHGNLHHTGAATCRHSAGRLFVSALQLVLFSIVSIAPGWARHGHKPFKLLPLAPQWLPDLQSEWNFHINLKEARTVSFRDKSIDHAVT